MKQKQTTYIFSSAKINYEKAENLKNKFSNKRVTCCLQRSSYIGPKLWKMRTRWQEALSNDCRITDNRKLVELDGLAQIKAYILVISENLLFAFCLFFRVRKGHGLNIRSILEARVSPVSIIIAIEEISAAKPIPNIKLYLSNFVILLYTHSVFNLV